MYVCVCAVSMATSAGFSVAKNEVTTLIAAMNDPSPLYAYVLLAFCACVRPSPSGVCVYVGVGACVRGHTSLWRVCLYGRWV